MKKTAMVTGATGFVGKNLAKRLLQDTWEVHVLVRDASDTAELERLTEQKVVIHRYDGRSHALIDILQHTKPDVVFHLASLFLAHHEYEDIAKLVESNILFGTQLLEAMAKSKVLNLVNTGTSWQHYQNEAYNPVCLYAATKQAFEMMMKYYQETADLKVITLKLFDTYGPNDTRKKLMYLLQEIAEKDLSLAMSPGEQLIDMVHIDDVVEAFALAGRYLSQGEYQHVGDYAVTSGNSIKLKELVAIYEKAIGKKLKIEWGRRPYREREVMITWKGGAILSKWKPKYVSLAFRIKKEGCL